VPHRHQVLVDISMHPEAERQLTQEVQVGKLPHDERALVEAMATCDGLIAYVPTLSEAALAAATRLKVIACHACPEDLLAMASRRGIRVTDVPSMRAAVADMTLALLFVAARNIVQADAAIRRGEWGGETDLKVRFSGHDIFGKTLGIVGLGLIGAILARRAQGFEMRILYYDPVRREDLERELSLEYVPLDRLLAEADIVSLHVRLDEHTRGMFGERELRLMKRGAILVNTARGALIDQAALYRALRDRHLAAAGLDVLAAEPIDPDDPLLSLDNVVLAPHLGGSTQECDLVLVQDVLRVLRGEEPLHPLS
jgi:glyoxylate reductase